MIRLSFTVIVMGGVLTLSHNALAARVSSPGSTPQGSSFALAIERVNRSVVVIETTRPARAGGGRAVGGISRHGSGFVVDRDGYIVTNNHVIANTTAITARFQDGRQLSARVIGTDVRTDLAVLKVESSTPLPVARFSTVPPALAAPVIALGAPLDFSWTATFGNVSGHGRAYDGVDGVDYLQHDAALNPGNSGGPLIDQTGAVVGVNTATPRETLFDIGIGLAIPASVAQAVALEIIAHGSVRRGWMGVDVQPIEPALASALGVEVVQGLVIEAIANESPALRAGLRVGDAIVRLDSIDVRQIRDLSRRLLTSRPGELVRFEIRRGRRSLTFETVLGTEPSPSFVQTGAALSASLPNQSSAELLDSGIVFDGAVNWSRDGTPSAARILSVRAGSVADRFGLRSGDGVVAVNRTLTPDGPAAEVEIGQSSGDHVALLVRRAEGDQVYVLLPRTEAARVALDASGQADDITRGYL